MSAADLQPERVGIRTAAAILGRPARTVQDLAARGEIPGAAKIGRAWTFNEARLRLWVRQREDEACPRTSTGAAKSGGRGSRSVGTSIDAAYAQLLGLRPSSA
jgi:excisionase family DNA binding protein